MFDPVLYHHDDPADLGLQSSKWVPTKKDDPLRLTLDRALEGGSGEFSLPLPSGLLTFESALDNKDTTIALSETGSRRCSSGKYIDIGEKK